MSKNHVFAAALVAANLSYATAASADSAFQQPGVVEHAPIGVMGDHMHKAGEVMFSLRYMHMNMEGNRIDTDEVSPETIATTVPNIFFGTPGQPPTLRVVPTEMTMDMIMPGVMYAPTDWLTLMAMGMYVVKEMDHITFQGGMGTTRLGTFTTKSEGFGDTRVTGLVRLYDSNGHHVHANLGLSLPSGSITESDEVLTPMGMRPTLRMPYAMQLGSGTVDAIPGLTYTGADGDWGWGAQALGTLRLGRNSEGYAFGDVAKGTAWAAYAWAPWISTSFRMSGEYQGRIDGRDANIVAPVQTANPDFYGGTWIELSGGINLLGQSGWLAGHRLAVEVGAPVYQDLNGPQMERDWAITVGWQKTF